MIWTINIEGKDHVIEFNGLDTSEVTVDGNAVKARNYKLWGVLMKKAIKLDGESVSVQRRELLSENWELVYKGQPLPPK
jgi:hypothetical protein